MDEGIKINDIVYAISNKIDTLTEGKYHIYDNKKEQGFEYPAFYIKLLKGSVSQFIGNRYDNKLYFDIHGFAFDDDSREANLRNMANLLENLEYIKLENGDLLNARNMEYEIEDGVLHYLVDYSFIGKKVEIPGDMMEQITME